MKKYIPLLVLGLLLFAARAQAAISFDATTTWTTGSSVSSITWNETVTSTANNMLFVCALTTNGDASTSYNGVSMTQLAKLQGTNVDSRYLQLFDFPNAATGTHAVVVQGTGGSEAVIQGAGISYAGVAQTTLIDASSTYNTSTNISNMTSTIVTVTNNDWAVICARNQSAGVSGGANTTLRSLSGSSSNAILDTNAPITPAGSTSLSVNFGIASPAYALTVAFAPFTASTAPTPYNQVTTFDW